MFVMHFGIFVKNSTSVYDIFAVKVTFDMHRSLHPSLKSETEFDYSSVVEAREKKG